MKRGLKLALVALALVAMAAPVIARAPVVKPLPIVIIGDEDAGDNDGTLYLMRHNDILNFGSSEYVEWNNTTYTSDTFHVYMLPLADAESSPRASTDVGLVDNMTNAAYVDLADSAVLPAASMDMTYWNSSADNFFMLSLIDDYINQMASTPMTDSYSAVVATHGVDRGATYGSSFAAKTDVLFVAAVTSGTGKAVIDSAGGMDTTIWTVAGATDSTTPTGIRKVFEDHAPVDDWYNNTGTAGSTEGAYPGTIWAQTTTSGVGVGYYVTGADSTNMTFGSWAMLDSTFAAFIVPHDGGGGLTSPVLEFLMTLQADAASPELCPPWRFFITNGAFSHTVALEMGTPSGHLAAPYAGSPYIGRVYVNTPYQLSEMGDDGWVAQSQWLAPGHPDLANDGRNYALQFDLMLPAGANEDRATFLITAVDVYAFEQPDHGTVLKEWSGAGAFDPFYYENWADIGDGDTEFWQGTYLVAPDGSYAELFFFSRENRRRFFKMTSPFEDAARVPFNGNTLVRKSITMGVEDVNATPVIQVLTYVFSDTDEQRGPVYTDLFGALLSDRFAVPKDPSYDANCVPPVIGSDAMVHCYHWMPTKVASGDKMIIQNTIYTYNFDWTNETNGWDDPQGHVRFGKTVIEEVEIPELAD